jgi:hypothetical protein
MSKEDSNKKNVPVPDVFLQKDSHEWDIVVKLINKDGEASPALSHWFLSCISQLIFKKESPRKKVEFTSQLR